MKDKALKSKHILKDSFKKLYDKSIYLLLFELIYKGLLLILFRPIRTIIVSLFIKAKSYEDVMDQRILSILMNSLGTIAIILAVILLIVLIYYEITVILMILNSSKDKKRVNLLSITKNALLKVKDLFTKKRILSGIYILMLVPILDMGIQLAVLPTLSIVNLINEGLQILPGSIVLSFVLGFALIYLFIKLFIVLPIMTFTDKSFKEASSISFKTMKGRIFKIMLAVVIAILAWIVLTRMPLIIFGNLRFRLPRTLRALSKASMTVFTLAITSFILALSLETFNSYSELDQLKEEEQASTGKIFGVVLKISKKILTPVENLILNLGNYKKTIIFLTLAAIIGLNVYAQQGARSIADKQLVIGHRGGDYGAENTVDTLVFSGEEGSDYVEMDVLLTKDNVPVVIHDNDLKRLASKTEKISDLEINEVKDVTIESGVEEDEIPTVEEFAKAAKGKIKILLEFKLHGKETESVIDKTLEILEQEGVLEDIIFQTAEFELVEEFNEKYEELSMGYIYKSKKKSVSIKEALDAKVDFISAKDSKISQNMVKQVHKAEKPLYAWTVNNIYKAEMLLNLGVDGIITDIPLEMIKLIDRYDN